MAIAAQYGPAVSMYRTRLLFSLLTAGFAAAMFFQFVAFALRDPDTYWHIKTGLDILANGAVPTVDTYSHTYAGSPWIAKEWLSQVAFALAYQAAGWNGVVLLALIAVGVAGGLLAWFLSSRLNPVLAFAIPLLAMFFAAPVFAARPHILTWPLIVAWTGLLLAASRDGRAPSLLVLMVLVLWANIHATFTLAFAIAGFAGLDYLARYGVSDRKTLTRWALFAVGCVAASLINPYGIAAITATMTVAHGNAAVPYIGEWGPLILKESPVQAVGLLGSLFGLLVLRPKIGWGRAAFIVFAAYMCLSHLRFLYVLFLLLPLIVFDDLADRLPASLRATPEETTSRTGFHGAWAGLLCLYTVAAFVAFQYRPTLPPQDAYPADAITFAKQQKLTGNVLNSYDLGGALILEGIPTFADGRSDQLFLGDFMEAVARMRHANGRKALEDAIAKYNIGWAILTPEDAATSPIQALPGWSRAYADPHAVIYVKS